MKPGIKFGLINGGIACLWSLLMYITGLNRSDAGTYFQWMGLIVPIVCIVQAVKEYKLTSGDGWVEFGEAFKTGFTVTSIGAIIGSVYYILFIKVIDPTFMDFMMNKQIEKMQDNGMSEEAAEKALEASKMWFGTGMQFTFAILGGLLIGTIIALIMAAILKKPNPDPLS
jgi:hypothetical protein